LAGTDPAACETGTELLDHLTSRHPLQPFSKAYFQPNRNFGRSSGRDSGLFTYAHEWREILNPQTARASDIPLPRELLALQIEGPLQLNDLIRFLKNPVQIFFNRRLKVYFDEIHVTAEDQEPFALDRLAPFNQGAQLLAAGLAAESEKYREAVHEEAERLRRTGCLPLKGFGELAAAGLAEPVLRMLKYHHKLSRKWPYPADTMEVRLQTQNPNQDQRISVAPTILLEDWLDGLRQVDPDPPKSTGPARYVRWEFYHQGIMGSGQDVSRLYSLLGLWVRHLAGCVQGASLTSCLIAPDGVAELAPLDREPAENCLTDIVMQWWSGLQRPLPVTARTALAYLAVMHSEYPKDDPEMKLRKAVDAARKAYQGDGLNASGELGYSFYLARAYPDFNSLWEAAGNQFDHLATSIYAPLLLSTRVHEISE
jgi:exodeoxyribonuclease V gamma subunit